MSSQEPAADRDQELEQLEQLVARVEEQNQLLEQYLRESERRREETQRKLVDVLAGHGTGGRR